jgi:hypothetical protein
LSTHRPPRDAALLLAIGAALAGGAAAQDLGDTATATVTLQGID